jgi:hypothetical protein
MYRAVSGLGALKVSRPRLELYPDSLPHLLPFPVDLGALRAAIRPIRDVVACGRVARPRILTGHRQWCEHART